MNNTVANRKIPTVLAVFVIGIGIAFLSYLVNTGAIFIGRASPGYKPENIRISNITDTSFTISYITVDPVLGSVAFGTNNTLGNVALDDRDQQSGIPAQHQLHYITVSNLKPNTRYFYTLTSATANFQNENKPFEVTIAPEITTSPSTQTPLVGKILKTDGTSPKEAVVYLKTDKATVASTLVKADGTYILPLNFLRNEQLSSLVTLTPETALQLLIKSPSEESNAVILAKQDSVPPITLSQNYDFSVQTSPIATAAAALIGFPSFSASPISTGEAKIISPKKEEEFTDQKPLFKGTATPGASVKITINSETIEAQVQADSKGNWVYRPTQGISPGKHTITITTQDKSGIIKTISQVFTVHAAGTQLAAGNVPTSPTPTPSIRLSPTTTSTPTPLPSSTPTPTTTPTPTITPTAIPTITIVASTPTPTIYLSPTPTPTPLPTKIPPQTKGEVPAPGNTSFLGIAIPGFIVTTVGIVLFMATRGTIRL